MLITMETYAATLLAMCEMDESFKNTQIDAFFLIGLLKELGDEEIDAFMAKVVTQANELHIENQCAELKKELEAL